MQTPKQTDIGSNPARSGVSDAAPPISNEFVEEGCEQFTADTPRTDAEWTTLKLEINNIIWCHARGHMTLKKAEELACNFLAAIIEAEHPNERRS